MSAYIAGNPRDAKFCHLVTHVNLITSNEITENIFDQVFHSCVDLNLNSFYDNILIKTLQIKMKLMTKIPNNLTRKAKPPIFIKFTLKKHRWKFRGIERSTIPLSACFTYRTVEIIQNTSPLERKKKWKSDLNRVLHIFSLK